MSRTGKIPFTFITLTYNHSEYIIEHLESIRYQIEKYGSEYEVALIIADDHSRDDTVCLAQTWIETVPELFSRAVILQNSQNIGTCANYTKAIEALETELFKVLAGDDLYAFTDIFSMVEETKSCDFISGIPLLLEDQKIRYSKTLAFNMIATAQIYRGRFGDSMRLFSSIHAPSLAYDRKIVDDARVKRFINEYLLVEDYSMQIKAAELNPSLSYQLIPETYVYYRRTRNSTYIIKNDRFLKDKKKLFRYLASRERSPLNKFLLYNRILCLDINSSILKMLFNLNAYIYSINVMFRGLRIIRIYNSFKPNIDGHIKHYQMLKNKSDNFLAIRNGSKLLMENN